MSYGPSAVYTVSMASGLTLSSAITFARAWDSIHFEIPTMTSGTDIYFQVSTDGSNFRRLFHTPTIGNPTPAALYVTSAVTNCGLDLDHRWYPYMKIELSTAMTATPCTFKVIGTSP